MKVRLLTKTALPPQKAHAGDLGYDLFADEDTSVSPGETRIVSTGVAIQFPEGYGGFIKDRSSIATQKRLHTVAGVIDNGYTGEIRIAILNNSISSRPIGRGEKIAQLVLVPTVDFPVEIVDNLVSSDERGENGFGSTNSSTEEK